MATTSCVYNVPMALDLDLNCTAGLDPLLAMLRGRQYVEAAMDSTVGPMPVQLFFDKFLPAGAKARNTQLSPKDAFKHVPHRAESVAEICNPLTSALNRKTRSKARCPGYVFAKTNERSIRPERLGYAKPHICCFTPDNSDHVARADPNSRTELGYAEFFIQVVRGPDYDFFQDPDSSAGFEAAQKHDMMRQFPIDYTDPDPSRYQYLYDQLEAVNRAFGLHIAFATEIFARQHRVFLYSVSVAGSIARFFRWERVGCIVTRAFDIRENPTMFAEFFWRFSRMTSAGRGHDLTVRMASPQEETIFRTVVRDYVQVQLEVDGEELDKAVVAHYQPGHVTVFRVDPQGSEAGPPEGKVDSEAFIVSRPVISPLSLDGHGTRGYWAVNAATKQIAFLKDTWRTVSPRDKEGDVLLRLNELGVRNVPLLAVHGDLRYSNRFEDTNTTIFQETLTDDLMRKDWKCRLSDRDVMVGRRRHYRLITHTVGYGLRTMRGTEELLHATYDAFTAMRDALAKDSRIHRDLSVGNIILVKEPGQRVRRGYLIDWEASDRVDETGEAIHAGRHGTWAFMSLRLLGRKGIYLKHTFKDDMESLLYVVFYCALYYTPHNLSQAKFNALHKLFFDDRDEVSGYPSGGQGKYGNAMDRGFSRYLKWGSPALGEWLNAMMDFHSPNEKLIGKGEKWEPDHVDAFWSHFLDTHDLETHDRTVFRRSMSMYYDPNSLSDPTGAVDDADSASPLRPKRRADAEPVTTTKLAARPSKRARVSSGGRIDSCSRSPAFQPQYSHPIRRSQRIRDRQGQANPTSSIVDATPQRATKI